MLNEVLINLLKIHLTIQCINNTLCEETVQIVTTGTRLLFNQVRLKITCGIFLLFLSLSELTKTKLFHFGTFLIIGFKRAI